MPESRPIFPTLGVPNCVPTPEDAKLRSTYLWRRYSETGNPRYRGTTYPAAYALDIARSFAAKGEYKFAPRHSLAYGPAFSAFGERHMRWIERPDFAGLRHVADCDTGWYLDEDGLDIVHGVVYQLPGKGGKPRYVAGYSDPFNDGPVCLSFDDIAEDERTAMRWADGIAERMAEEEREYQVASSAAMRFNALADEIATARRECLAIFAEVRQIETRQTLCKMPHVMSAIRERIKGHVRTIREARRERENLRDTFGYHPGWQDAIA